jgi:hypothetical protein
MRVLISHAAQDHALAQKVGAALAMEGFDVWNPDQEIFPGDNWALKWGQALEQCEILLVLYTRGAMKSDWLPRLRQDVQFALTSGNYAGRVVPVAVGFKVFKAGEDIPWILLHLDPVYLESAADDLGDLVERVRSAAEAEVHAAR